VGPPPEDRATLGPPRPPSPHRLRRGRLRLLVGYPIPLGVPTPRGVFFCRGSQPQREVFFIYETPYSQIEIPMLKDMATEVEVVNGAPGLTTPARIPRFKQGERHVVS